jgi:hypothetical protein
MVAPRLTNSIAYSTWKSRPSGEKTVIARSYAPGAANTDIILTSLYYTLFTVSYNNYTKNLSYRSKFLGEFLSCDFVVGVSCDFCVCVYCCWVAADGVFGFFGLFFLGEDDNHFKEIENLKTKWC